MAEISRQAEFRKSLAALHEAGVVPAVAAALDTGLAGALRALGETVLAEIPAFSASGNPDVLPELEQHAAANVNEIRRLLGGGIAGEFEFVREHARRRAEQKFPLEATLHAYRCGHKVLSRWIRDATDATLDGDTARAMSAVVDFSIEYTDTISTIATYEYVARTRQLAEAEGDRRTELLTILLNGYDESDGRVARLLRRAGYLEQRQSFCVAVAQSVEPLQMENPARAQRLADAVADAVSKLPVRVLIGIRDDLVVGVFSDTRRVSGWTAPQTALARRIAAELLRVGPAAVIALSSDAPSTSHIPRALGEAKLALEFADVSHRVVQFAELPARQLVLRVARDNVQAALPAWIDDFLALDRSARGTLSATLRAYADADMNLSRAAHALGVHANTIYARMQRIEQATGLDALRYHALTELLLAIDCRAP